MTDLEGPTESLVEIFSCKRTPAENTAPGNKLRSTPSARSGRQRGGAEPEGADWPASPPPPPCLRQNGASPQLFGPACGALLCLLNIIKNCLL